VLKRLAADHLVAFKTFVQHLSGLFWSVDALVCMGGYNTVGEALSKGFPVVCVPRVRRAPNSCCARRPSSGLGCVHLTLTRSAR